MSKKSAIDEALELAKRDPSKGHVFYDAFLNSKVFLPVRSGKDDEPCFRQLESDEKFFPLFLKREEQKVIPVFDSLDRLKYWAEGEVLDYVLIQAHQLLKMIDPHLEVGLNFATPYYHLFTTEDLSRIRAAIKPVVAPSSDKVH